MPLDISNYKPRLPPSREPSVQPPLIKTPAKAPIEPIRHGAEPILPVEEETPKSYEFGGNRNYRRPEEPKPKSWWQKLKTYITGGLVIALLGSGAYLASHRPAPQKPDIENAVQGSASDGYRLRDTVVTEEQPFVEHVVVNAGDNVWKIAKSHYDLHNDPEITKKVHELEEYNLKHNPSQKSASIDDKAFKDGKLISSADHIGFDRIEKGSVIYLPIMRKVHTVINYFEDDKGNLYDEDRNPITHSDLERMVQREQAIQRGYPEPSDIANNSGTPPYMGGDDYVSHLLDTYMMHTVKDTLQILGITKYRLYNMLDHVGTRPIRKRNYPSLSHYSAMDK